MFFPSSPSPRPSCRGSQCQGVTLAGQPCQVTSRQLHVHAASLRCGSSFCQHHQPDKFTGIQCAGVTKHGARCRVFSGSTYANAAPLRDGKQFCRSHATAYVRCAGTTKGGAWCCVSSRSVHAGADPLREGGVFCAKHALPPADGRSIAHPVGRRRRSFGRTRTPSRSISSSFTPTSGCTTARRAGTGGASEWMCEEWRRRRRAEERRVGRYSFCY